MIDAYDDQELAVLIHNEDDSISERVSVYFTDGEIRLSVSKGDGTDVQRAEVALYIAEGKLSLAHQVTGDGGRTLQAEKYVSLLTLDD